MVGAPELEKLLRHLPATRREMVINAILSEEYLAPAKISMPFPEFERLLAAMSYLGEEASPVLSH